MREKISPQPKEKQTKKDIDVAKKQAAEQGTQSVFDIQPVVSNRATTVAKTSAVRKGIVDAGKVVRKPRPKEVRFCFINVISCWLKDFWQHKYSTANFKISHRKLNMLANQISGKPVDWAILQMQFSEKRASARIMNMLATAKDHATRYKRLNRSKLIVCKFLCTTFALLRTTCIFVQPKPG